MSGDFISTLEQTLVDNGVLADRVMSVTIATTRVAISNHKAPNFYWWVADDDNFYFPWVRHGDTEEQQRIPIHVASRTGYYPRGKRGGVRHGCTRS